DEVAGLVLGELAAAHGAGHGLLDAAAAALQRRLLGLVDHDRDARPGDGFGDARAHEPPADDAGLLDHASTTLGRAYPWASAFDPRPACRPRARWVRGIVVGAEHHGGGSAARCGDHAVGAAGRGRG